MSWKIGEEREIGGRVGGGGKRGGKEGEEVEGKEGEGRRWEGRGEGGREGEGVGGKEGEGVGGKEGREWEERRGREWEGVGVREEGWARVEGAVEYNSAFATAPPNDEMIVRVWVARFSSLYVTPCCDLLGVYDMTGWLGDGMEAYSGN